MRALDPAVVVLGGRAAVAGDEDVDPTVSIVVERGRAEAVAVHVEPELLRHVGEVAQAVVLVRLQGLAVPLAARIQPRAVHDEQVLVPVVVEIDQQRSGPSRRTVDAALGRLFAERPVRLAEVEEVAGVGGQEDVPQPVAVHVSTRGAVPGVLGVALLAVPDPQVRHSGGRRDLPERASVELHPLEALEEEARDDPASLPLLDPQPGPGRDVVAATGGRVSDEVQLGVDLAPALLAPALELGTLRLPQGEVAALPGAEHLGEVRDERRPTPRGPVEPVGAATRAQVHLLGRVDLEPRHQVPLEVRREELRDLAEVPALELDTEVEQAVRHLFGIGLDGLEVLDARVGIADHDLAHRPRGLGHLDGLDRGGSGAALFLASPRAGGQAEEQGRGGDRQTEGGLGGRGIEGHGNRGGRA